MGSVLEVTNDKVFIHYHDGYRDTVTDRNLDNDLLVTHEFIMSGDTHQILCGASRPYTVGVSPFTGEKITNNKVIVNKINFREITGVLPDGSETRVTARGKYYNS